MALGTTYAFTPTGNGFSQRLRMVVTPLQLVRSNLYEEPWPYKDNSEGEGTCCVPGQKVKVLVRILRCGSDVG